MNRISTEKANPNNCGTCQHKRHPDGGWCYMFRDEPTERCYQHTPIQIVRIEDADEDMEIW